VSIDRDQIYNERQAYRGYVPDTHNVEEILTLRAQKIRFFYDKLIESGFEREEALLLAGRLYVD